MTTALVFLFSLLVLSCHAILGSPADLGNFPFMVPLQLLDGSGSVVGRCSGTILENRGTTTEAHSFVLTAATCVNTGSSIQVFVLNNNGVASLGAHRFTTFTPVDHFTHPDMNTQQLLTFSALLFNGTTTRAQTSVQNNNIGILELDISLAQLLNETNARPVSLATSAARPGVGFVTILGTGQPSLDMVTQTQNTQVLYSAVLDGNELLNNDTVFAADLRFGISESAAEGVQDGDAGGPWIINGAQAGVSTTSLTQATVNGSSTGIRRTSVATAVPSHIDWINSILNGGRPVPVPAPGSVPAPTSAPVTPTPTQPATPSSPPSPVPAPRIPVPSGSLWISPCFLLVFALLFLQL